MHKQKLYWYCYIRILQFFLLVVQGIESNPGPGSQTGSTGSDVRGRGSDRGSSRGSGRGGRGREFEPEDFFPGEVTGQDRRVTRSSQSQTQSTHQLSIDGLLNSQPPPQSSQQQQDTSPARSRADSGSESDLGNEQLDDMGLRGGMLGGATPMNVLLDIHRNVIHLNRKFDHIQKSVTDLKKDKKQLKQQNEYLTCTKKVRELSSSVAELECSSKQSEIRYEKLEAQSRRENLRFFDISEEPRETWDQSEQKVRDYISGTLGINDSDVKIERAHRLPGKSHPRPLIVKFSYYKDKDRILKRYREIRDERNRTGDGPTDDADQHATVRISEDFPRTCSKSSRFTY